MTTVIELCLVILTVVILIIAGFLISMIIQVKRTAREAEITLKEINEEINPLISKINDAVNNIKHISEELNLGITSTANAVRAVENVVKNVSQVTTLLSAKNLGKKILVSTLWIGIKAGVDVIKNRLFSRRK